MTKLQQILYQLFKEIHEICIQNEIPYTLHPQLVLFLQNGSDIPEDYESRCVYMTAGNLHRFVSVCSRNLPQNRSIESMHSNPMYPYLYSARYGNTETLHLNVNEGLNYINNGLFVRIEVLRSYPQSKLRKKIFALLEWGWRANTYQYTVNRLSKKELFSKTAVRCMLLFGRKNLGRRLYDFTLKAYQYDNTEVLVCWKNRNVILPQQFFEIAQLTLATGESFYIPVGWEKYLERVYGKEYMSLLEKEYTAPMSIVENPYISSNSFFEAHPQLGEFFRQRMGLQKEKMKMKSLLAYREFCWAMINMVGDKYKLRSDYEKNRLRILNLREAKNYDELMSLFEDYYKTQRKYAKYNQTFSIDPELDEIYYATLRRKGKKQFAEKMKRML